MRYLSTFRWIVCLSVSMVFCHNLLATTPAPGRTYSYDANGRLTQVVISTGTSTVTLIYTYDKAGNLLGVTKQ